jgi:hypothetical protein
VQGVASQTGSALVVISRQVEHIHPRCVYAPDMILIDIAGSYEQALTISIARAHLTIIPASTTEADIYEAARVARHIQTVFAAFGKIPLYRVLATRVAPLVTHAQAHGFKEIARLKLPLFSTIIAQRAAEPKKARGEHKVLVWRSTAALSAVEALVPMPLITACTARAFEFYCGQPALVEAVRT